MTRRKKAEPVETEVVSVETEAVSVVTDLLGEPVVLSQRVWTSVELGKMAGVTPSRIRQLCIAGRLPGAVKVGRDWLVPDDVAQVWLKHDRDRRRSVATKEAGSGI